MTVQQRTVDQHTNHYLLHHLTAMYMVTTRSYACHRTYPPQPITVFSRFTHAISLSLSLQSSAVEQVLDILMDILSWEIANVVFPCLPRGLWSHIVIRVFLLHAIVTLM